MFRPRVTNPRRPFARAFLLSVFTALVLALPSARTEAAQKGPVDFGPGKANELFSIPKEMWSNINQFAFLVCYDEPQARTALRMRLSTLPGYLDLVGGCQVWGNFTFPDLQKLATELSQPDIKNMLLHLQAAFGGLQKNPAGARAEFDQAAASLDRKLATLTELSARVNEQSMRFYRAGSLAIAEYKKRKLPDFQWVNIGPKLDDVGVAMGSMVGRWNILTSNLAYLRKTLALPSQGGAIPDLYDLDIEVGLSAWDEIAQRAGRFLADAPAQLKYLSGQNYYEECPLREDRWYVMRNSFLEGKGLALTAQRPGPIKSGPSHTAYLMMKPQEDPANATRHSQGDYDRAWSQQWKFHRLRNGWWSIESRVRNDVGYPTFGFLVDSTTRVERVQLGYNYPPARFWWRCLATPTGWFRLVNASFGEVNSLDTYNDQVKFFPAFMGSSTDNNYSGQYWRFVPSD